MVSNNVMKPSRGKIVAALSAMFLPGDVFEIRVPKHRPKHTFKQTTSGYFDNPELAADAVCKLQGEIPGVYVTLNPVDPALLGRANNRLKQSDDTSTDAHIVARRWLLVDLDAKRPAGTSSSHEEKAAAKRIANGVAVWLADQGWPACWVADSGNGYHLLYSVDLPNTDEMAELFSNVLKALDDKFSNDDVDVDLTVFNAARICKLYGTPAAKGDSLPERPHRQSELIKVLGDGELLPVPLEKLTAIADLAPKESAPPVRGQYSQGRSHSGGDFHLEDFLTKHSIAYRPKPGKEHLLLLDQCPFNPEHGRSGEVHVEQKGDGKLCFSCKHNSCRQHGWRDFREYYEPGYQNRPPEPPPLGKSRKTPNEREQHLGDETLPEHVAWMSRFVRAANGSIKADIANARLVLQCAEEWQGVLGYCDFSYRIIKRKKPPFEGGALGEWQDSDTDRLRIWLSQQYGFTPKSADAHGAVIVEAEANPFHPVRDYLRGLKWDGKHRATQWLVDYLGVENNKYHQLVGLMWMVGAVARVMQPPVKVDNVLIFEGLQGLGKSTALAVLGGEWFSDTPFVLGDKDGFQQLQGVWIIELAELDAFNRAESTRAKQFFGSSVDRYRPSYGRIVKEFPRQCVFAGSTNQDQYLKDATGNRRYWPVRCTKIEKTALARDRDQLWAEAVMLYDQGALWYPQEQDKHLFEAQQEDRFDTDVWEELIEYWLRSQTKPRVLISELMEEALKMPPSQMKPPEQKRVGLIMSHLGWNKVRTRVGAKRETGYERPPNWKLPEEPISEAAVDRF